MPQTAIGKILMLMGRAASVLIALFGIFVDAQATAQAVSATSAESCVRIPADGTGNRFKGLWLHAACQPPYYPPHQDQWLFWLPSRLPSTIRSVAYRRYDDGATPQSTLPAFSVVAELWMGHSVSTPASFGYTLGANRGADFTRVMAQRTVSFAAEPYRPSNDYPFSYRFVLDTPFTYISGRVGLLEVRLVSSTLCFPHPTNLLYGFEGYNDRDAYPYGSYQAFGSPCGGGNTLHTTAISVGNPGFAFMDPQSAAAPGFGLIYGGLSNTQWAGLGLPYSLTTLGAPGCTLYASADFMWPEMWPQIGFGGAIGVALDLPNDPTLVGATVYGQGVRFDPSVNALGIATSNAVKWTVVQHFDPTISSLRTPFGYFPTNQGGQRVLGGGPVLEYCSK